MAMWLWFLIPVIADVLLEESLLSQSDHLYVYYANQPLKLHTFPLWWAQEGWFWSKPVLDFWLQGLAFALFGVKFRPDEMLSGAAHGTAFRGGWVLPSADKLACHFPSAV